MSDQKPDQTADSAESKEDAPKEAPEQKPDGKPEADAPPKTPVYKKPLFWVITVVILAVVAIGATLYILHARQYESTDDAFVDAHIVRISAQSAGKLVQVADIDNRHVDAGRLLAVIEPSGPEAHLAEAQAGVVQAQAQVAASRAQVVQAQAQRDQAAAQARGPLAAADKAAKDLARYEELRRIDPNAVAGQQLDQARAQARSTAADAAAARKQITTAAAQVAVARRQVTAQAAEVGAKRAVVNQASVTLGDLRLTAPVSGQVVNRAVNLGSYVAPGTQLMAIVPDSMWITANFKETQLQLMKIGQAVSIHVDAFPGVEFAGHVDSIQRGAGQAFALLPAQNATGNYVKVVQRVPVRILFDLRNGADPRKYPIGPGMSVVPTVKVR